MPAPLDEFGMSQGVLGRIAALYQRVGLLNRYLITKTFWFTKMLKGPKILILVQKIPGAYVNAAMRPFGH
jgi:hypothetical protein